MNLVILSDPHYRNNTRRSYIRDGISSWLYEQIAITKTIFDYAVAAKATVIVNGDIFNSKNRIDVGLYNTVWKLYEGYSEVLSITINTGNHDLITLSRDSALRPFSGICSIVDEPAWVNPYDLRVVPYGMYKESSGDILFCHEDIAGLSIGGIISRSALLPEMFSGWNKVFNGHIHDPQTLGNIINIGSIMAQNWGEAGNKNRFLHLTDSGIKSIPIDCPQFIEGNYVEGDKRNFYRVKTSDLGDPVFKNFNVTPIREEKKEVRKVRLSDNISIEEEMSGYIALKNKTLEKDKLLITGKHLIKGE